MELYELTVIFGASDIILVKAAFFTSLSMFYVLCHLLLTKALNDLILPMKMNHTKYMRNDMRALCLTTGLHSLFPVLFLKHLAGPSG